MKATKKICILGGSGFVGRHLSRALVRDGHQVRVLSRHPQRHRDLASREIEVIETDVYNAEQLRERFAGMHTVINLVGILNEHGTDGSGFRRTHVELPQAVVAACKGAGVRQLLHMSALKAGDPVALSHYLRSKGEGENAVHTAAGADLAVTSFRPSVIFGQGDDFLNRFASLLRVLPVMPLACSGARFSPVYVGDVVAAFSAALNDPASNGKRYDLCGPKTYTLRQIVDYLSSLLSVQRIVLPLTPVLSQLQARILEWVPGKPFSMDNYLSLQTDATCVSDHRLPFAITPVTMEMVAPYAVGNSAQRIRYNQFRSQAGREI